MAFDQSTRNRLQKFVNDARNLLTEEFTRQLQATYGLDPNAGSVASVDSLTHLDNRQRQTASVLRDALAHYLATTHGKGEKDRTKQALSRIVREQAFTVLNRLAALRMAEARGFLLETIAKGYNAKGFQLYKQLAGSSLGETGEAYCKYLYSVFDEFSLDLAVLFDRHSAQGRLFPRESALLELLDLINHHEIEPLWAEDETIGWIYQYFNSQEERKQMRAESQAPRNSRELAVRNQFFTPRYVVEFLTDNTLGRIWYEMTQGKTSLVDSCRYLVRRPTEVFLKPGELAPEQEKAAGEAEALSQEELLKQPVYILHRAIKDPRCIRMLDPACGSMHFGLYAFDLYERIYQEAWQLESELGAETFVREGNLKALHQTYDSFEDYRAEIPRLIIEHNIHGVDIDHRAVQIAGLSLWQRAQRAWQQQDIKPQQRPVVRKSNIVCAEPMPGEKALLQEFSSSLNPPVMGQLLEAIFDKMELAGEAGTLLKIEEEIQASIHEARDQWQARSGTNSVDDMFQVELDKATPQNELGFDLSGVDDESFWDGVEQLILDALSNYADKAASNADQKRLFAEDAAKGFAFIELCRKRFDGVLMNPPFGDFSMKTTELVNRHYKASKADIYASFIARAIDLTTEGGCIGAITSKTGFYQKQLEKWRTRLMGLDAWLEQFCDLGYGVLDTATVETAAYVIGTTKKNSTTLFYRLIDKTLDDKEATLGNVVNHLLCNRKVEGLYSKKLGEFSKIPGSPLSYWVSSKVISVFSNHPALGDLAAIDMGMSTKNDFRWTRCFWEVPAQSIGTENRFCAFAKGSASSALIFTARSLVDQKNDFRALKAELCSKYSYLNGDTDWVLHPEYHYKMRGLTFGRRTRRFRPLIMQEGAYFSDSNPGIFFHCEDVNLKATAAYLSSRIVQSLLGLVTPARKLDVSYVAKLPVPVMSDVATIRLEYLYDQLQSIGLQEESVSKSSILYKKLAPASDHELRISDIEREIDEIASDLLGLGKNDKDVLLGEFTNITGIGFEHSVENSVKTESALFDLFVDSSVSNLPNVYSYNELMRSRFERLHHATIVSTEDLVKILSKNSVDVFNAKKVEKVLFEEHLKEFTDSPRVAPLIWPLQTSTGSYTLWCYYHALSEQTLYTCINDFIDPKIVRLEQDLNHLHGTSARENQDAEELEKLTDIITELRDFRDEMQRVAKFWKPNLNDGVQITAAPLWKLFQHKTWQKKLKNTWEKLENGDYDWAHLACSIWPERVLRKCHQDRSLAIAHDVENTFWHEVEVPVKRGKEPTGETKLELQPKELTDDELDALILAKIMEKKA